MLVSLPVAAGPAWLCLCQVPAQEGCCCSKHAKADAAADQQGRDHAQATLEKRCCCSVEQGSGAPAPAPHAAVEPTAEWTSLDVVVVEDAGALLPAVVNPAPARVGANTGPPPQLVLLSSVRLRP